MKKKTYKLAKLERSRYSILTPNLDYCILCGKPKQHLHEIFEGSNRLNSIKYGFVVPVCFNCHNEFHNNRELSLHYKRLCQKKFEKDNTREEFIKLFRRNYLC